MLTAFFALWSFLGVSAPPAPPHTTRGTVPPKPAAECLPIGETHTIPPHLIYPANCYSGVIIRHGR